MFKLRIVQAFHGDCLILECGPEQEPYYLLIDGGPGYVYEKHLKKELVKIRKQGGKINLAVLSHVDDDHVNGLLDLLAELISQRRKKKPETIEVVDLWHNAFGQTLGESIERGMARSLPFGSTPVVERLARSIKQGNDLATRAQGLRIPTNAEFRDTPDRVVCVDNVEQPIPLANMLVRVVGPTREALKALQAEWEAWLAEKERAAEKRGPDAEAAARALDDSVPNLSSIMLLAEAEGKTVLLTGDGRGDHILEGLEQAGVMQENGTCHVDVFKLPHHGSAYNASPELFERVTADIYIICANGENDNPDFQTLEWLVQAAKKQHRSFTILATTETDSIQKMVARYDPLSYQYKTVFLSPGVDQHSMTLDLCNPTAPMIGSK